MLWTLTLLPVLLIPWAFDGLKAVFLQLIEGWCSKRLLVFKSGKRTAPNAVKFSSNAIAESQQINSQIAQAIFHASPEAWRVWNAKNVKRLKAVQTENGSWTGNYGTTFSTSAALLSLALNYRFLPIYER